MALISRPTRPQRHHHTTPLISRPTRRQRQQNDPLRLTDAQRQLVEDNQPLAFWAAGQLARRMPYCTDDTRRRLQDLMIVKLVRAAATFDPLLGSFATYAMTWLKLSGWGDFVRQIQVEDRLPTVSLSSMYREHDCQQGGYNDADLTQEWHPSVVDVDVDMSDLLASIRKMLEPRDYDILCLRHIEGLTLRTIARKYGVSKERVRQVLLRATATLQAYQSQLLGECLP